MAGDGRIRLDPAALISAYPINTEMPDAMAKYMRQLKDAAQDENKKRRKWNDENPDKTPQKMLSDPTQCCFQISHALNMVGGEHKIPPRSFRRDNAFFGGQHHIGAVDELAEYLKQKYGPGEVITKGVGNAKEMQGRLAGRQGILTFSTEHTEIWDKSRILQNGFPIAGRASTGGEGAAIMNQGWVWTRPNILFWEIASGNVEPSWIAGWWEIEEENGTYYYYFFRTGVVVFSNARPDANYCPRSSPENSGTFTVLPSRGPRIDWGLGFPEVFSQPTNQLRSMTGRLENVASGIMQAVKLF